MYPVTKKSMSFGHPKPMPIQARHLMPDNIKALTVRKRLKIMNMRGGTAKNM